jgi:hypothetical protein
VAGRKIASPTGAGGSTLDGASAAGPPSTSPDAATGSPDDPSSLSDAPDQSSPAGSTTSPDVAHPHDDDPIPGSWWLVALAAVLVIGLALALLVATRPRGGAHRRH